MISPKLYNEICDSMFGFYRTEVRDGHEYGVLFAYVGSMVYDGKEYEIDIDFEVKIDNDGIFLDSVRKLLGTRGARMESLMAYGSDGNGNHISDLPEAEKMLKAIPADTVAEMNRCVEMLLNAA